MSLLEVQDLEAGYGPVKVVHGVTFSVEEGGIAVILGANGAGKTTTLRAVSGMIRARGRMELDGKSIARSSTDRVVRLGVAHVPQGRGTFADLTVEENLRLGGYVRRNGAADGNLERCYSYFPVLKERASQQAGSLSGGEQQMLAIARALMLRPRLFLLDEPSLGLAPKLTSELFRILGAINEESGTTMLIVEQNANLALDLAGYAYVLEAGRIAVEGPAEEIKADESVRRAYLGY
ncbi:MAG: ABC transporter ATP-binding protein [Actinomycetota bacterium]